MGVPTFEERRALNIFWTAAGDNSLKPARRVFDEEGRADLYRNFIVGAACRYYDHKKLEDFFRYLKRDVHGVFYEDLTWLGIENCAYQRAVRERRALEPLRRAYAERVVAAGSPESAKYFLDELRIAHFRRVLGLDPGLSKPALKLLNELEFDESVTTDQILAGMREIIRAYFEYHRAFRMFLWGGGKRTGDIKLEHAGTVTIKRLLRRGGKNSAAGGAPTRGRETLGTIFLRLSDEQEQRRREYMERNFGLSISPQEQIDALEHRLCSGNHRNCHILLTRGDTDGVLSERMRVAREQYERNRAYFQKNLARNRMAAARLADRITNTVLVDLDTATYRAESGLLTANRVWRNLYLDDPEIFLKNRRDDAGQLSVDILLDASGSQVCRQEAIAEASYVIAEGLTRSGIPVRAYSFFDRENYMILNLLRDYNERMGNDNLLRYHSLGCNRDGLAVRTVLHLMEQTSYEKKLLFVLSDAKPNDAQAIFSGGSHVGARGYCDMPGIADTAAEVHSGVRRGMHIFCVFTGLDEDLPAAKKIYGHNLVRIRSMDKFVDAVCGLIQNELRNA